MTINKLVRSAAVSLAILGLVPGAAQADDITVFAAASLKTALDTIAADWNASSGDTVVISYAGSPQLAKQIEAGAPADLFISAAPDWMDALDKDGLIDGPSRVDLLGNSLVLVAPADDPAPVDLTSDALPQRLGTDGKLAMALTASVPAGVYGKQALTTLGLWDKVSAQVAEAENVRAALVLVARGEAPLGIVYATDAHAEPKVATVATFPADSHAPITYPAALTTGGAARPAAKRFLAALSAAPARAVFTAEGFTPLTPAP